MTKYLFYDTETSGFMKKDAEKLKPEDQPWIVQMGLLVSDGETDFLRMSFLIKSEGRIISPNAEAVHKISVDKTEYGFNEILAGRILIEALCMADIIVCHNTGFDIPITVLMYNRIGYAETAISLKEFPAICTMKSTTDYCKLPAKWGYKWPKLEELHQKLFGFGIEGAHDALVDVEYTKKCFFELKAREII